MKTTATCPYHSTGRMMPIDSDWQRCQPGVGKCKYTRLRKRGRQK